MDEIIYDVLRKFKVMRVILKRTSVGVCDTAKLYFW